MPKPRLLSAQEARRAIYIDFEGNTDKAPTLLGVLHTPDGTDEDPTPGEVLERFVLELAFAGSVGQGDQAPKAHEDLVSLVIGLIRQARHEKRRIVSWSHHDHDKIMEALGNRERAKKAFASVYRDGKKVGEAWTRAMGQTAELSEHSLELYMRRVCYDVPPEYGPDLTGDSLRDIRKWLEAHASDWSTLNEKRLRRFHAVLMHNSHDLWGMRAVVMHTAEYLAVRKANEHLPVEQLRMLSGVEIKAVLRAWVASGALRNESLAQAIVADARLMKFAPRSAKAILRTRRA